MRKMLRCSLSVVVLCWSMLLFIRPAMANCTINVPTATTSMPLQLGNITVGADLAVGKVLYKQTYNLNYQPAGQQYVTVTCSSKNPIMANYTYTQTPLPLSAWGSGQYAGKVYETGVAGIGIYVHEGVNGSVIIPASKPAASLPEVGPTEDCQTSGKCTVIGNFKRWDVFFIKTGNISPGTITGGNLPCVGVNYTNDVNSPENQVANICMSGSINVVASTCKTPDVTVPMGSYDVSAFNGKGSATKWNDASIKLTDCPVYYGYGSSGSWYADGSGTNNSGSPTKNALTVQLTPVTTVVNNSEGIFSLLTEGNAAGGVGIQLAYGNNVAQEFVNFAETKTYQMELGSTGISTIPLVARYIQTDTRVTPGQANSAVTFTINYY